MEAARGELVARGKNISVVFCLGASIPANDLASAHRAARENWPEWYAAYTAAEQAGKELPQ